mmetsp:Transcript_123069/g.359298  ORF Transcript_123069/g.359298 Transcript_123069/m.359298 type:complete len:226 (+) Transcript_123069:485-1162(+)
MARDLVLQEALAAGLEKAWDAETEEALEEDLVRAMLDGAVTEDAEELATEDALEEWEALEEAPQEEAWAAPEALLEAVLEVFRARILACRATSQTSRQKLAPWPEGTLPVRVVLSLESDRGASRWLRWATGVVSAKLRYLETGDPTSRRRHARLRRARAQCRRKLRVRRHQGRARRHRRRRVRQSRRRQGPRLLAKARRRQCRQRPRRCRRPWSRASRRSSPACR